MAYLLNALYLAALVLLSPWLGYKALTTGKYRRGLLSKFFGNAPRRTDSASCAWFHGVSVGEVYLLRQVVSRFQAHHPDWECVISTTTDTGFAEARKSFPDRAVFYWPLDFTWAVRRALRRVNPSIVILAESELWPNFIAAARQRGVPVALINARVSPRSLKRYARLKSIMQPLLMRIDVIAAQTPEYAEALRSLGAAPERVHVTGSVKFDGVHMDRYHPAVRALHLHLDVADDDLILVAGSTQAPEEAIILEAFKKLKARYAGLRLFLVPRQRERFNEVAGLLERSGQPFVRRSAMTESVDRSAVVLVDTIGELAHLWGLAHVAYVGGSLDGRRGGQNMIEPAAYGAAVVFGPHVWNFADAARRLVDCGGAVQIADAAGLERALDELLGDAARRARHGQAARQFVLQQQGATERTIALLAPLVGDAFAASDAA